MHPNSVQVFKIMLSINHIKKKESGVKGSRVFLAYFLSKTFHGETHFNGFLSITCMYSNINIKCNE